MYELLECLAITVQQQGVHGLSDLVPSRHIFGLGLSAYRLYVAQLRAAWLQAQLRRTYIASTEEAKRVAAEVARKLIADAKEKELPWALELLPLPPPERPQERCGKTVLEGGRLPIAILPFAEPFEAEAWQVPLRGSWFTRSAKSPDAPWIPSNVRLPGEVIAQPGEAYRFALQPDSTSDEDLAQLRALVGLPGLEAIDLSGCARVTDAGLMHLAYLRGLKAVGLTGTQVSDSGVKLLLARFPKLEVRQNIFLDKLVCSAK